MLSDDFSSMSLEVTKEGVIVVGKTIESLVNILLALKDDGKDILKSGIESTKNKIEENRKGETTIHKMYQKGEPLTTKDVTDIFQSEKWRRTFDAWAETNHFEYAVLKKPNAEKEGGVEYSILFKQSDAFKAQDCIWQTYLEMASYDSVNEIYGKECAENLDYTKAEVLSPEQKERIRIAVKEKFTYANSDRAEWNNEKVWEEAWKDSYFSDKRENIFSEDFQINGVNVETQKKDVFLFHVQKSISSEFGRENINENLLHIENKGIVYLDGEYKLHYINLGDKTHISQPVTDKETLKEVRQAIAKTNSKLKTINLQIENKYKDYTPEQKEFLRDSMERKWENPNIDVSQFDRKDFPVEKMASIRYCQEDLTDIADLNRILEKDFSAEQINVLYDAMLSGVGKEELFNPELSPSQMRAMTETLKENPFADREQLQKAAENISMYQKEVEMELFGGEIDNTENTKTERVSIDETIMEVRLEKSIETVKDHSQQLMKSPLKNEEEFSKFWFAAPAAHIDEKDVTWKEVASFEDCTCFVNENMATKVLVNDRSFNPKSEEFNQLWDEGKPLYVDKDGTMWKSTRENLKGRVIMNDRGKTFVERKEYYKKEELKQLHDDKKHDMSRNHSQNISAPSHEDK